MRTTMFSIFTMIENLCIYTNGNNPEANLLMKERAVVIPQSEKLNITNSYLQN